MNRFNNWVAVKLGNALSNMWFFWFCVILDLLELKPVIDAHSVITWCTYISQTVIQLLALPLLGAMQKLQEERHDETINHVKAIHKHLGIKNPYRRRR